MGDKEKRTGEGEMSGEEEYEGEDFDEVASDVEGGEEGDDGDKRGGGGTDDDDGSGRDDDGGGGLEASDVDEGEGKVKGGEGEKKGRERIESVTHQEGEEAGHASQSLPPSQAQAATRPGGGGMGATWLAQAEKDDAVTAV